MPGCPLAGCLVAGFGAGGVAGVVIPVHFPVGGDRGRVVLPVAAGGRGGGHRDERVGCPGMGGPGGVVSGPPDDIGLIGEALHGLAGDGPPLLVRMYVTFEGAVEACNLVSDFGELAQAPRTFIHHRGDLSQVGPPVRLGQLGDPSGPGALRLAEQRVDARADPGADDCGDVAGSGQVPGCDGRADDLGGVQAGQFGGVQGAEQPPGLVR